MKNNKPKFMKLTFFVKHIRLFIELMDQDVEWLNEKNISDIKATMKYKMAGLKKQYTENVDILKEYEDILHNDYLSDGKNKSTSEQLEHDALLENEAERSELLIAFMKWYKNTVPIGTQKSSVEIVKEYLSN